MHVSLLCGLIAYGWDCVFSGPQLVLSSVLLPHADTVDGDRLRSFVTVALHFGPPIIPGRLHPPLHIVNSLSLHKRKGIRIHPKNGDTEQFLHLQMPSYSLDFSGGIRSGSQRGRDGARGP